MVFFAGRVADFGAFTAALKARTCVQRTLTVVIVATAAADAQVYANTLTSNNCQDSRCDLGKSLVLGEE
jgi:hypothetical protein